MSRLQTAAHAFTPCNVCTVPSPWVGRRQKGALQGSRRLRSKRCRDWRLTKTVVQLPPPSQWRFIALFSTCYCCLAKRARPAAYVCMYVHVHTIRMICMIVECSNKFWDPCFDVHKKRSFFFFFFFFGYVNIRMYSGSIIMNAKYETWRLRSEGVTCKAAWTGSRNRCTFLLSHLSTS